VYDKNGVIPNVGRESDTYLRYIIEHYEKLPERMFFLQGNPFEHFNHSVTKSNIIQKIKDHQFKGYFEPLYPDRPNCRMGNKFYISQHWGPWGSVDMEPFAEKFFYRKFDRFTFCPGAQFVVSRQAVTFRRKEFYEKLIKEVNYDVNPLEGHFLERLWQFIFDHTTKDKITHAPANNVI
jgi:hypothetical protein